MHVLAVIHGDNVRPGVFGDVIRERGHRLEEWSLAWGRPLPRPLEEFGAVLVFGGAMHADQESQHPWLRDENAFIQDLLERRTPALGVCLGVQLLAKAAGAAVYPAREPEIGWVEVELTGAGARDPLFARLPRRFDAFQWHHYSYDVPEEAEELARSSACTQAFRLGDTAWGIQFHAEVTHQQVESWLAEDKRELPRPVEELRAQTRELIGGWNELGRTLSGGFLELAERTAAPAAV